MWGTPAPQRIRPMHPSDPSGTVGGHVPSHRAPDRPGARSGGPGAEHLELTVGDLVLPEVEERRPLHPLHRHQLTGKRRRASLQTFGRRRRCRTPRTPPRTPRSRGGTSAVGMEGPAILRGPPRMRRRSSEDLGGSTPLLIMHQQTKQIGGASGLGGVSEDMGTAKAPPRAWPILRRISGAALRWDTSFIPEHEKKQNSVLPF